MDNNWNTALVLSFRGEGSIRGFQEMNDTTYDKTAVEPNSRRIGGDMEVTDQLIHIWEGLGERDGVCEPGKTQGSELGLWDRGILVFRGLRLDRSLVAKKGAGLVAGLHWGAEGRDQGRWT